MSSPGIRRFGPHRDRRCDEGARRGEARARPRWPWARRWGEAHGRQGRRGHREDAVVGTAESAAADSAGAGWSVASDESSSATATSAGTLTCDNAGS